MRNARSWAPSPSNHPFDLADPQSDVSFVVSVFEILKREFYRASGDAKFKPVFKLANPATLNLRLAAAHPANISATIASRSSLSLNLSPPGSSQI